MNPEQALETLFRHNRATSRTFDRLCRWDESKTAEELTKILGFNMIESTRAFKDRFGLSIYKIRRFHNLRGKIPEIKILRKEGLTMEEIGKKYDCTKQSIYYILNYVSKKGAKK